MKNCYEVGRVYIWQNQVGDLAHYNGTECTITGPERTFNELYTGLPEKGWPTDTPPPAYCAPGTTFYALPGDLRPKNPPPGEQSVLDMFKQTEPEAV
jgi:hypothetical protein